ncbi:MAG TPA: flagellar protein FlaG [Bryobacteraceae bacterium]|jgi:flagellar protein FlaG
MDVASIQNPTDRTDVTAQVQTPPPAEVAQRRELVKAVQALNQAELFGSNNQVTFAIDRDSKRLVTKVVDRNTGEVVDQIPAEYVLKLAEENKQNA